jgi:hypothetical protein
LGEEVWDAIIEVVVLEVWGSVGEGSVEGEIVGGEIAGDNFAGVSSEGNSVAVEVVYPHWVDGEMAGGNFVGETNWESIAEVEGVYSRSVDVLDDNAANSVGCNMPVPKDANLVAGEVYYNTSQDSNTHHSVSVEEIPRAHIRRIAAHSYSARDSSAVA